jgi:hypothetical protein
MPDYDVNRVVFIKFESAFNDNPRQTIDDLERRLMSAFEKIEGLSSWVVNKVTLGTLSKYILYYRTTDDASHDIFRTVIANLN